MTESFKNLAPILPLTASTLTIHDAHSYIARVPTIYRYRSNASTAIPKMCAFIDRFGKNLTLSDRAITMMAPVQWRDEAFLEVLARFLHMYVQDMNVDFLRGVSGTPFMPTLLAIEERIASKRQLNSNQSLETLEAFHKVAVFYLWMALRNNVAYSGFFDVTDVKKRIEVALEWVLQSISQQAAFGQATPARSLGRGNQPSIPYRPFLHKNFLPRKNTNLVNATS